MKALGMVFIVTVCFWSIFGFDMVGDVFGQSTGLCVLVVLPSIVAANAYVISLIQGHRPASENESSVKETLRETRIESVVETNQRFSFQNP
jgi:hypothetical protein